MGWDGLQLVDEDMNIYTLCKCCDDQLRLGTVQQSSSYSSEHRVAKISRSDQIPLSEPQQDLIQVFHSQKVLHRFFSLYPTENWYLERFVCIYCLFVWFLMQKFRIKTLLKVQYAIVKLPFRLPPGLGHLDKGSEIEIFEVCGLPEPDNTKPPTILLAGAV